MMGNDKNDIESEPKFSDSGFVGLSLLVDEINREEHSAANL